MSKGHNSKNEKNEKKKKKGLFELSPLTVWIALWIVNTCSKCQANIFSNNGDIKKYQFLHNEDKADAKAIRLVFSEDGRANKTN